MKRKLYLFIMGVALLAACAPSATSSLTSDPHALAGTWTLTQTVFESNREDVTVGFSEMDEITITVQGERATITTADGRTFSGRVQGANYITASRPAKDNPNTTDAYYDFFFQNNKFVGSRESVYPGDDISKVVWELTGVRKE